ncbi:MAG: D-aminoacyl-tRNA deacylase [Armatimonadota bacterium]|nr:MAG: D-aminoacyl-tRNA deacylase [Armatimonadota bacterium]
MRAVVQRVADAHVDVDDRRVANIGVGLLVLLGVARGDRGRDAAWMADRVAGLRIFPDEQGKMNLSVRDVGGEVLAVSQFTLLADARRGRRPGFSDAAPPEEARVLFDEFVLRLRESGISVSTGEFQAHMRVGLTNDGPVTIILDSRDVRDGKTPAE